MALSPDSARSGATVNRLLNKLAFAVANEAADITTATTSDRVIMVDASADYEVKYADGDNLREMQGITATAAAINAAAGVASTAAAITATSGGLTTGLIPASAGIVIITSADANHIATLPGIAANSLPIGHTIKGRIKATGCELRTPATSDEEINGVDADSAEMALAANKAFVATVEAANGWQITVGDAVVPD